MRLGETVKLGYVDQSRDSLDPKKNVWEEISSGLDIMKVERPPRNPLSRAYVGSFNFTGADQQKKVGLLSGGERTRVHLAKTLAAGGNVLMLDQQAEPTNDLDVETLGALRSALEDFPGCAVVISHDRFFLDRLATHILAFEGATSAGGLVRGQLRGLRGRQEAPPGRRQPHPPPHPRIPEVHAVGANAAVTRGTQVSPVDALGAAALADH